MSSASQLRNKTDRIGDAATSLVGNLAGSAVEPKQGAQQLLAAVKRPVLLLIPAAIMLGYVVGRRRRG